MADSKNLLDKITSFFVKKEPEIVKETPRADYYGGGTYHHLFSVGYNGEKNLGEMGLPKNYVMQYDILRIRSHQSYIESEITQIVMSRLETWVIGKGLKLQAEPSKTVLEEEKITLEAQKFSKTTEARFNVFRKSKDCDYSGMLNLDMIASEAYKNSIIGGDALVVLRYGDKGLTIQLIDGAHVQSQIYGTEYLPQKLENGNRVMNGIEVDEKGKTVAYWVRGWQDVASAFKFERIEVYPNGSDLEMAFLIFGSKYRINNVRGVPLIANVLETLKKLERYKEATVGSAEERQKIPYTIEHGIGSTGENPLQGLMAKAHDIEAINDNLPVDINGKELANTVAATTNKATFNMPIDSKLTSLETKNELYFKDFYTVNIDLVCASLSIPPNVAMSKYDSNFSASRAALKDWEHTLGVIRHRFQFQFYQKIYNVWLHIEILKNKINAPGYLMASIKGDGFILTAYRNCRFIGSQVPHIDPLKEVNAERAKLGLLGVNLPFTTLEAATEALNGGESFANMEQFAEELEKAEELELTTPEVDPQDDLDK